MTEIVRKKFIQELRADQIKIGTEEIASENESRSISTIDILLKK